MIKFRMEAIISDRHDRAEFLHPEAVPHLKVFAGVR